MLNHKQHKKIAVITGITGQDGAYLAKFLLAKKYRVVGLVRKGSNTKNLKYLGIQKYVKLKICDLMDLREVQKAIQACRPQEVYNLAAVSSVGESFRQPLVTMKFNTLSVLNLLETIRLGNKKIKFYQASSSEMFGKVSKLPVNERTPLNPLSPYAVSKAAAHLLVGSYRQDYGLYAAGGILFNHESVLRSENFFVKKIITQALAISKGTQDHLEVGNVEVKRDFGYSPKYVEAMWLMLQQEQPKDYFICSGESIKLSEVVRHVFRRLGIPMKKMKINKELYRPAEILDIYGDCSRAKLELGWNYDLDFHQVLDMLIQQEQIR